MIKIKRSGWKGIENKRRIEMRDGQRERRRVEGRTYSFRTTDFFGTMSNYDSFSVTISFRKGSEGGYEGEYLELDQSSITAWLVDGSTWPPG